MLISYVRLDHMLYSINYGKGNAGKVGKVNNFGAVGDGSD